MKHALALAAASVLALIATACSTGPTGGDESDDSPRNSASSDAFPVTVKSALGTTEIEQAPQRIVTVGWSDHDVVAALGVVPVGVPQITWGGNERKSTDWFDKKVDELGGTKPQQYSDADGVPADKIAAMKPDLILATNSGITAKDFEKLNRIAPTVAYPKTPWGTSWQESTRIIGKALGKEAAAKKLITDTERSVDAAIAKHPALKGRTAAWINVTPTDTSKVGVYLPSDNRPRMLSEFGLKTAPVVTRLNKGHESEFSATVSAERAGEIDADITVFYTDNGSASLEQMTNDPLLKKIPSLANGSYVEAKDPVAAYPMSSPTPLSIPTALEDFLPLLDAAARKAK